MKRLVKKVFDLAGFSVSRKAPSASRPPRSFPHTTYHSVLLGVLAAQERISIVQIGANDGMINDPLYEFTQRYLNRTSVLLIEPQEKLVPVLRSNYEKHPNAKIANCAVGGPGSLTLYSVNEAIWGQLKVAYAVGWPIWRAPTGVTSTSRDHVEAWIRAHLEGATPDVLASAIDTRVVRSCTLQEVLDEHGVENVDVLQVDAEGADDLVLRECGIEANPPLIINFESRSLTPDRMQKCLVWLNGLGYDCFNQNMDTLCLKMR